MSDSRIVSRAAGHASAKDVASARGMYLSAPGDDELDRRRDLTGDGERRQRLHAGPELVRQPGEEPVEAVRVLVREQRDGGTCRLPEAVAGPRTQARNWFATVVLEREQVRAERGPVVTGLEAGDHGAGDDEPEEVARCESHTSAAVEMDARRDGANRLGDVVQGRKSEDERDPICKAAFRGGQERESRSSRDSHESDATARDIGPRDHFPHRSPRLHSGGRSERSDGQALGLHEDRQPAGRREAPPDRAERRVRAPTPRHAGKEHDRRPGRRPSPGPVDERG